MGVLATVSGLDAKSLTRHWPLLFLLLGAFLFSRNDPGAWPLGPQGFWESLAEPAVLQHRFFVLLVLAFGVFEWGVRTGRFASSRWQYVFPLLCAVGGGVLLSHSHAMLNLKSELLIEVSTLPWPSSARSSAGAAGSSFDCRRRRTGCPGDSARSRWRSSGWCC